MTMGKKESHNLSLSSNIYCIIFWGKLLLFILLELFLHCKIQILAPTIKCHNESSCYYILLGISKKQILESQSNHS